MELESSGTCFACGVDNEHGLHMKFEYDLEMGTSVCRWTATERFHGFDGVVHGGIVATLLDEAVANLCYTAKIPVVTAEMNIRYVKTIPTGVELVVEGRIEQLKRRIIYGFSQIVLPDGEVAAKAELKLMTIKRG
jgi:uncharacterized protein (TIGR00369 family)